MQHQAKRARELADKYPSAPVGPAELRRQSQVVRAALDRWENKPEPVEVGAPSSDELAREIRELPPEPKDDFFAANIPDAEWDSRTVEERATDCFEWQRVRSEALEPLISGRAARWYPFDFDAGLHPDGTYWMKNTYVELEPAPVICSKGTFRLDRNSLT